METRSHRKCSNKKKMRKNCIERETRASTHSFMYINENHFLSLLFFCVWPFSSRLPSARASDRSDAALLCECVALNAIASRLRAYFVFSCNLTHKTNKPPICTTTIES